MQTADKLAQLRRAPIRTARAKSWCWLCGLYIQPGQQYRFLNLSTRAHLTCAPKQEEYSE